MLYVLDSHAWIEYFLGSKKGEKVKSLFKEGNEFLTVECCLAEIKRWALRNSLDFIELYKIIRADSGIVSVTQADWVIAADIWFEQRKIKKHFGLMDAMVVVKQKENKCYVVTGDHHFKDLKKVVFLS